MVAVKRLHLFFQFICVATMYATSVQAEMLPPWPSLTPSLALLQSEPQTRPEAKNLNPESTSNLQP